ncbi:hypothetical protein LCGC14_1975320, partial [marine sediment metagenome]
VIAVDAEPRSDGAIVRDAPEGADGKHLLGCELSHAVPLATQILERPQPMGDCVSMIFKASYPLKVLWGIVRLYAVLVVDLLLAGGAFSDKGPRYKRVRASVVLLPVNPQVIDSVPVFIDIWGQKVARWVTARAGNATAHFASVANFVLDKARNDSPDGRIGEHRNHPFGVMRSDVHRVAGAFVMGQV